jgi:predicted transcriptional regulator
MVTTDVEGSKKVRDYMTANPIYLDNYSTLQKAIDIMVKHRVGNLVVKDASSSGILTEREILHYLNQFGAIPDMKLYEVTLRKFSKVSPDASVIEAAKTMISSKTRLLVYNDANEMVGIITTSDLLRALFSSGDRDPSLEGVISRNVFTLESYATTADAVRLMENKRIGSVVVTVEKMYDGIFTERDLLSKILTQNIGLTEEIGKYCSWFMLSAREGVRARDAAGLMLTNKIKRLPITRNGEIVGIVTARDLVEAFVS